jgi:hypothetical protein
MLRRFLLSDERECWVFDVSPTLSDSIDPALCDGWLCFDIIDERRRLGPIPAEWKKLSDTDLADLWKQATPIAKLPPENLDGPRLSWP